MDDGINKDVLGRCTAVDSGNGTITVSTPTTYGFSSRTPVKISIYLLKDIYISNENSIKIGEKGFKGKEITAGVITRVYYTNNSRISKIFFSVVVCHSLAI